MRKKYKPITPGTRHQVRYVFKHDLGDQNIPLTLRMGKLSSGGRNNHGCIVSYNRGGGNKNLYRKINYDWKKVVIIGLQYDPNRTGYVALVKDVITNDLHYILASESIRVGDVLVNQPGLTLGRDNITTNRGSIAIGTSVYNIQVHPTKTPSLVRSAGTFATVLNHLDGITTMRMPSGKHRRFISCVLGTLGMVSCSDHFMEYVGKAGRNRHWGWRPHVRGIAINPIDHPHGGRTNGGTAEITPWGWHTKGLPTRSPRKNSFYVVK